MSNKRAMIAMSGGVDSSVSAYLMKMSGYDCIGATMKLFSNENVCVSKEKSCCSLEDVEDARSVAYKMHMPYYVFNFSDTFNQQVIERFVQAYEQGITPNPCIDCNRYLKFDKFFQRAKELGYDYIVTGHYARIEYNEQTKRYELKKAFDKNKDQSYVLYTMTQEQLAHTLFPLGNMTKDEVRAIAAKNGFVNAKKHDSQDICFVQDGDYVRFIEKYRKKKYESGAFVDSDGNYLGEHKGIIRYTIGQRKGLGISFGEPKYVADINSKKNEVVLTGRDGLYSRTVLADNINLISVESISEPMEVTAKVRYSQKEQKAVVKQINSGIIEIEFEEPQRAVTKGQAVVLYDKDTVVGGGTITEAKI